MSEPTSRRSGFDRLRTLGTTSAALAGLLGAASGRAASFTFPSNQVSVTGNASYRLLLDNSIPVSGTFSSAPFTGNGFGVADLTLTDPAGSRQIQNINTSTTTTTAVSTYTTPTSSSVFTTIITNTFTNTSTTTSTAVATWPNAFDGALVMAVNGQLFQNPDGIIDLTNNTLTSDTVIDLDPGIDATVAFRYFQDRATIRAIYTLANTTGSDIPATVIIGGALGSAGMTVVQGSYQGGSFVAGDSWVITNGETAGEDARPFNSPTLLISRFGINAPTQATIASNPANNGGVFANEYDVTIPAGETVRLMVFAQAGETIAELTGAATDIENLAGAQAAGLLAGLSASEIASIVNYLQTGTTTEDPTDSTGGGGGITDLFGGVDDDGGSLGGALLGVLGLLAVRRRRH